MTYDQFVLELQKAIDFNDTEYAQVLLEDFCKGKPFVGLKPFYEHYINHKPTNIKRYIKEEMYEVFKTTTKTNVTWLKTENYIVDHEPPKPPKLIKCKEPSDMSSKPPEILNVAETLEKMIRDLLKTENHVS